MVTFRFRGRTTGSARRADRALTVAPLDCNDLERLSGERDPRWLGCPSPVVLGESPRLEIESEEMSMKKKLEVKIRKLEKIETTINRGGSSG
ncbi:hypothetical protein [Nonomuraea indica]|uniref:hypothetical protein n=1 Tax=Nonomuraea indica TaxID=1581193 RepID=UPI0011835150|nr:hypothetical protein [Nonomuraea indica]